MITKTCATCGKEFTVYEYRTITSKFCSYKCAGKAKKSKIIRKCRNCGKEFTINPSQFKYYKGAGKYCSRDCSYKGIVTETSNKPIKDKYQRTYRKEDRLWILAVREKGNWTCKRCGIYDKHCHTHHLEPRSRAPSRKHDLTNGICLCGPCHYWVHHNPKKACEAGLLISKKY